MGVRSFVTRLLPAEDAAVIVECRHCGCTVEPDTESCPACGAETLARYEIGQER
jgi:primosomal protein N'